MKKTLKRNVYTDEEIIKRAGLGLYLNLRELGVASGYGYSTVRKWRAAGMKLMDGRITLKAALQWRKAHEAAQPIEPSAREAVQGHRLLVEARLSPFRSNRLSEGKNASAPAGGST